MVEMKEWDGFDGRLWKEEINVRQFIQDNYTPYEGNEDFLTGPTESTNRLWDALQKLQKEERAKGGVLDMETKVVSGLTAYGPGYIDEDLKDLERSLVFRQINHSNVLLCHMAVLRWRCRHARLMVMK